MQIRISHRTHYAYERPVKSVRQVLRLSPQGHDGQHVVDWRVELDADAAVQTSRDPFGNIVQTAAIDGPIKGLEINVTGIVETTDTHGIISGTAERFAPGVFLRETPLTEPVPELTAFAEDVGGSAGNPLDIAHRLLTGIHQHVTFDTAPTHAATTAAEAFALGRGVCQDLTHIFLVCARHRGLPARYVSGYFVRNDGVTAQEAGHAWAEAWIENVGWVGFDPANGISPTDAHVRIAIGLDYLGAAPIRGSRYGGGQEKLDVALTVAQSMRQAQN